MSDVLEPGDPLLRAVEALQQPAPIAAGFPQRVARRRVRNRRRKIIGATLGISCSMIALVLIGGIGMGDDVTVTPPPVAMASNDSAPIATVGEVGSDREVPFTLNAPASSSVALVGDFNDWKGDSTLLHRGADGKWAATLRLPPGRYRFAYVVDNKEWRADSLATLIPDDFGRPTSVVTVTLEGHDP